MKIPLRIKILSAVFVLLAVVAVFALQKKLKTSTIRTEETEVAVPDTSSVKKITILKGGQMQVLSRTEKGWKVNNRYPVRINVMNLLLVGLSQLQVKRPVSNEMQGKALDILASNGTRVTIEYGDQKKTLTFATNENDVNTTFLVTDNSKTPYIAYVPGVPGDINNIFKLKEHEWRNRELFASHPASVQNLRVEYPSAPANDFEIFFEGGSLSVRGIANLDTAKLENYLSQFQFVPVSGYLVQNPDSINVLFQKIKPYATIHLTDINSERSNSITLYDSGDRKDYVGRLGKTGESVTINREIADRLLVKRAFFASK